MRGIFFFHFRKSSRSVRLFNIKRKIKRQKEHSKEEKMKSIYTTAIIVALSIIASLDASANTGSSPGPGKKPAAQPVVQTDPVTPPSIDRSTIISQVGAPRTANGGFQTGFAENDKSDTIGTGDAVLNTMFGAPTKEPPASNTKGRREVPTLKRIDK